jgi:predicted RNase H-like HicB family nuclease
MKKTHSLRDYQICMYFESNRKYYVASVPAIPFCAADGPTPQAALGNLEETYAVLKESYLEEGMEMPAPTPTGEFNISSASLKTISKIVKISALAAMAEMSEQTLASKIARGSRLSIPEAHRLEQAIRVSLLSPLLEPPKQRHKTPKSSSLACASA